MNTVKYRAEYRRKGMSAREVEAVLASASRSGFPTIERVRVGFRGQILEIWMNDKPETS